MTATINQTAQQAIELTKATQARRFVELKVQFVKHGHTLHQYSHDDGSGPVSYLAECRGLARYLPTEADAEKFLIQVGGADHE